MYRQYSFYGYGFKHKTSKIEEKKPAYTYVYKLPAVTSWVTI